MFIKLPKVNFTNLEMLYTIGCCKKYVSSAWSLDGKEIAFQSERTGNWDI